MKTTQKFLMFTALSVSAALGLTACTTEPSGGDGAKSGAEIQTTGEPGSPSATTTISGSQLPPPDPKFGGVIKENAAQSKAWWPPRIVPPKGAPNVLLILTDDVGYGAPSTFGGVIPTPALDRIANNGLRYINFHTTALCSPTRAALITGRNHHSEGFGVISEISTGFPGYNSIIPDNSATIGRILRDHGYSTAWFGKAHNTPTYVASQAGPFDKWPTGMGFQHFYGFLGGETSQWQPNVFKDTTPIYPYIGHPGWNLTTAMADDAVHWLHELNDIDPAKPFLCYYAPGGTHAPHNPTPEWIKKAEDLHLFDQGWNDLRDQIFANQKKLGVIPQDTKLTPWPDDLLKTWDKLSDDEKKLFIRQADVYAAYLMYTDHEIGRVIQAVADMGKLDNTLIIYISGDNGASAEGSVMGTPNENCSLINGIVLPAEAQMKSYDHWGDEYTYPHYAVGWAWALDTPFKWTKQIPSFFGGTRNGVAISWPGHIKDAGAIRSQFHHIIDVVPTILEAAHINAPEYVDGIKQKPIEGISMDYTFDAANANAPTRHQTQYFEMFGVQGLYHDGWMLSAVPQRSPWELLGAVTQDPAHAFKFQLYDVTHDWSQYTDVSAQYPDKVRDLHDLMFDEFKKYQVFPLDASAASRYLTPRPSVVAGRRVFNYSGEPVVGIPDSTAPNLLNTSYTITADINVPDGGAEGVIVKDGGRFGGYGFYLLKGKPVFCWNLLDLKRVKWEGPDALTPGHHTVVYDFKYDGLGPATLLFNNLSGIGRSGTGTLKVDGQVVATQTMDRTIPNGLPIDESFDIGSATGTPVDDQDYQIPFAFTGKINKLVFAIEPPQLTPEDIKQLKDAEMKSQDAK
jgi:arylsulfatase A-like enzyme